MNETMETVVSGSGDNFWREHLIAAWNFSRTKGEYSREHDLNHKICSFNKIKMGRVKKNYT